MIHVKFMADDPPTNLLVLLGPDRVDVSSGYGGWTEVARPKRATVTTWEGRPARRMAIGIIIDDFVAGRSVENDIRALERLALPRPSGPPPTVTVEAIGGVIPPFYERLTWVVDAIAWGDAQANADYNRTRQAATVTLLEFITDDLIQTPSGAERAKAKAARDRALSDHAKALKAAKGAKNRRHKVAKNETLSTIARDELGDAHRWREIGELNGGIRDPRSVKVGQTLRLP